MKEVWKDVVGFQGYVVSNKGRVKGLRGKVLSPAVSKGYEYLSLYKDKKPFTRRVHKLVAGVFVDRAEGKDVVHHRNADLLDNRATNLEWVTVKENIGHTVAGGKLAKVFVRRVGRYDADDNLLDVWDSSEKAAEKFGTSKKNIRSCCGGFQKTCIGFRWEYMENKDRGRVYQYDLSGERVAEYESIAQASRALGISSTGLYACASGKTATSHGYIWLYEADTWKKNIVLRKRFGRK